MLLMDTHVFLWSLDEDDKLSGAARKAIANSDCCISIVTLWEMAVKASLAREERRLDLKRPISEFQALCREYDIEILPVTPEDCSCVMSLPHIHEDPFDRMIIAQAVTRGLPLVTRDENIHKYAELEAVW